MSDITDQDRRVAHEWATTIGKQIAGHPDARTAARVILATVDAPAPTLADELRDVADNYNYGMSSRAAERVDDIADRVEHELAEARAEVEQAEDRAAEWQGIAQRDYAKVELLTGDLTEARAEVDHLKRDLTEAYKTRDARDDEVDRLRAEVERLTDERDGAREEIAWLLTDPHTRMLPPTSLDPADVKPVQKGAESNAETPDPADVPAGEAWLVECYGEKRNALKDGDRYVSWDTVDTEGYPVAEANHSVTLVTRLVPAPRTITNADDLDRAKRDTVIRDARGVVCSRDSAGTAWTTFTNLTDQRRHIVLPATVLWEPEA